MLIRKCLTTLSLLLMLAILVTRCTNQYTSHVQSMTLYIIQAIPLYKKLTGIGSPQDMQFDKDGNPSSTVLENKDINDLYNATKSLHDTVNAAMPTSLSAHIAVVQNTPLNKHAQQIDTGFQNYMTTILKKIQSSMAAPPLNDPHV